jgi:hypothetical protein
LAGCRLLLWDSANGLTIPVNHKIKISATQFFTNKSNGMYYLIQSQTVQFYVLALTFVALVVLPIWAATKERKPAKVKAQRMTFPAQYSFIQG